MSLAQPFRPSGLARFLACPGSSALTPHHGGDQEFSGDAAFRGTLCHLFLSEALRSGRDAKQMPHIPMEIVEPVQWCIDRVRGIHGVLRTEVLLEVYSWYRGTCDILIHSPETRTIHVFDAKFGQEPVSIGTPDEPNPQLAVYARGASKLLGLGRKPPWRYVLGILQPAVGVSTITIGDRQLDVLGDRIKVALALAKETAADIKYNIAPLRNLNPSAENCRWCPVSPKCPVSYVWRPSQAVDTTGFAVG